MLDFDLAEMYGIENRVLKQAVRRNLKRFEGVHRKFSTVIMIFLGNFSDNDWCCFR